MKFHSVSRTLLSAAIAAVVSTSAMADAAVEKGFIFSLGGAYNALDSARDLDDSWAPEIGVGYRFDNRWSLEGVYSEYKTDHKTKDEAKVRDYRLDGFYDLTPWDGDWTPYAVMGVGHFTEKFDNFSNREDTRMSLGAGIRKALTPNLSLSTDVRAIRSLDYGQTEGMAKVALTWTFGSAPAPAQTVIVEEQIKEPVEPPAPIDSDMDGVPDDQDMCPGTPAGSTVDSTGCVPMEDIDLLVEFGFDSDKINPAELDQVVKMGEFLNRYQDVRIRVIGHTDSQGPAEYNQTLSQRRAEKVREILVKEHGVNADRIEAIGKGESEPLADNKTLKGRQENRRVVAEILK